MAKVAVKHLSRAKHMDITHTPGDDRKIEFVRQILGTDGKNAFKLEEGEGYTTVIETEISGTALEILETARSTDASAYGKQTRPTAIGDIIEVDGEPFMVAEYGFRNIFEKDVGAE